MLRSQFALPSVVGANRNPVLDRAIARVPLQTAGYIHARFSNPMAVGEISTIVRVPRAKRPRYFRQPNQPAKSDEIRCTSLFPGWEMTLFHFERSPLVEAA